jgi:hypothetical protein
MFWHDLWLSERPLLDVYPSLFLICSELTFLVITVDHGELGTLRSVEPFAQGRP